MNGADDVVTVIAGTGNAATFGANLGGPADVFNGSKATVTLLANALVNVNGSNDTISAAAGSILTVTGAADAVTGSGAQISFLTNAVASVTGAGDTIAEAAGATPDGRRQRQRRRGCRQRVERAYLRPRQRRRHSERLRRHHR